MTSLAEYVSSRELFTNLTLRELRSKYKRSVLGWAWSLLNPLATTLIFTLVFKYFLKITAPPGNPSGMSIFALFLLCGLLPWNYMNNGIMGSIGGLVGNGNLVKKTYFPRSLIVFAQIGSMGVSFLLEMSILLVALLIFGNVWLQYFPALLVIAALLTLFITGLSLVFSVVNVYFRDVQHLVGIIFQVWFYLTPIMYSETYVPKKAMVFGHLIPARAIYDLNPMTRFVDAFRNVLYDLRWPSLATMGYITLCSFLSMWIGMTIFNKLEGRLAEEL